MSEYSSNNSSTVLAMEVQEYRKETWAMSTILGFLGSVFCVMIIIDICRRRRFNDKNLCVLCMSISGLLVGISCAIECLWYLVATDINYRALCKTESMLHFVGVVVNLTFVDLFVVRSFVLVYQPFKGRQCSIGKLVVITAFIAIVEALSFGLVSGIQLMPSRTWCFYKYSSPAIKYGLTINLALTIVLMILCFTGVYIKVRETSNNVRRHLSGGSGSDVDKEMAKKIFYYIGFFIPFWIPELAAAGLVARGLTVPIWLDVVVMFMWLAQPVFMPVIYYFEYRAIKKSSTVGAQPLQPQILTIATSNSSIENKFVDLEIKS